MNDPWDVKCVRQAGQYVSCMKINGVPLLPPVLSKECRKEMQYYRLLAKEVDKRISLLQPYVADSDSESEDRTDAPELPECEYELPHEQVKPGYYAKNLKKYTTSSPGHASPPSRHAPSSARRTPSPPRRTPSPPRNVRATDVYNNITSNVVVESVESGSRSSSPKLIIDLSLSINNESGRKMVDMVRRSPPHSPPQIDLPERDYNCTTRISRKVITEKEVKTESHRTKKHNGAGAKGANYNLAHSLTDPFADNISQDGPASLSAKSFTGSLNDLHRDSLKDLHNTLPLARQRSYTLLKPSPQLLAHLEVQSLNTGVEMSCISMSESLSSLSPTKKRRSWDLESAKVKWSTMALELKQTKANNLNRNTSNKNVVKQQPKPSTQSAPVNRAKTVVLDKTKRTIRPTNKSNTMPNSDPLPKSEPVSKTRKSNSPGRNNNRTVAKDPGSIKTLTKLELQPQNHAPPPVVSESEDPAARVRELYEKIQNQQLLQMASLVEKQKREQMLLQQVFEEQNNLLFKQLKTICPTSPIEIKEAWGDKHLEHIEENDRGPVSLSQLINYKSPDQSSLESPVSNTLTNTNNYISHCDNVLKKSRDITGSIKKQPNKARSQNGNKIVTPRTQPEGSKTRTQSPDARNTPSPPQRNTPTSRRLNYETSASSDRDYDPMLTDRTNDTMADLNVTFPSDNDDGNFNEDNNSVITSHVYAKEIKTIHATSAVHSSSAEKAIRNMERTIHNSINSTNSLALASRAKFNIQQATPKERAAATKIVALAKGYLVRRLMRTDRVQATVQTIKDALLCALQLHQDREGIRGADVDLHRRLIQQITAACYSLHDTFVASTAAERCAMIAADRGRRRSLAARQLSNSNSFRQTDLMTQSHTGAFPARAKRPTTASLMTQSNYETFSDDKGSGGSVSRHMASPHRRPWR
ncbi:hypothetical protein PYW07_004253 [Mythimna separata]|uniref:Centriolar coiled-coil protein of 110 kDa n=1 Tax=Mythimna separata TaxID=271217 RepID=A0AAD7YVM9_MYTSE|nr:hypothetical protein PYW07_004253 [Mythimna separata]